MHAFVRWMLLSGAAALLYELAVQKVFSYVLGGSLASATITVGAYMAGLATGALLFGRLARGAPGLRGTLRIYAAVEAGIAMAALAGLLGYAAIADQESIWVNLPTSLPKRALMSFLVLLPFSTLVGGTFPVIARAAFLEQTQLGGTQAALSTSALYAGNLIGAVAGTVGGAYLVLPALGLWGAVGVGVILNIMVAVRALRFAGKLRATPHTSDGPAPAAPRAITEVGSPPAVLTTPVLALAFGSGLVLFALEIVWTHLLAAVAGSSVYAFSNMLAAVLVALAIAARRERNRAQESLGRLVLDAGLRLGLSIPMIALCGYVFAGAGLFLDSFALREAVRFLVALAVIAPTAVALSRIFPRLLDQVALHRSSTIVGRLTAANTLGCFAGLLLGRFVLVDVLGSLWALRLVAVALSLGALVAWRWPGPSAARTDRASVDVGRAFAGKRPVLVVLAAAGIVLPWFQPAWLLSGRNIYFSWEPDGDFHHMLSLVDDAEAGFVTVHRNRRGAKELRSNGKIEGNDTIAMQAQASFAYLPALASEATDSAFLIGLGTGVTAKGLADFPFGRIDVVERATPIVEAARAHFTSVNGGVLDDPRVRLIHDDGRHALLHSDIKYDVISIQITSIWFAGAADLYSRDFYRVAGRRLSDGGVLQQWLQLHHMRLQDLWIVLNTVRAEFPHVALWFAGAQGQILASRKPLSIDWARLRAPRPRRPGLGISDEALMTAVGGLLLDERGVEAFLGQVGRVLGPRVASMLVSTDLWPYLEYATPRGNVLEYSDRLNVTYLREKLGRPAPVPLRNTGIGTDPILPAARAYLQQDCAQAALLSQSLGSEAAGFAKVFSSCAPWFVVPRISTSTW